MFRRFTNLAAVHFIGIGGAGMSGIAEVLLDYDLEVSGCDQSLSETTERLSKLGVTIHQGHSPEHVERVDLVVISSAVSKDSPEVVAARRNNITVVRRAEMLGELMRLKYGIAVAGTHGKTTTTSLIGTVLTEAGLDPTVIVGGRLRVSGTGARLGKSEYLVAEADEYDRSFLRLQPIVAVVTSIDEDHLDTYANLDEIRAAFVTFAGKVPFFGQAILCLDDANIQALLPRLKKEHRVVTYGLSPQADLKATDFESTASGSRFNVVDSRQGELGTVELPMPGLAQRPQLAGRNRGGAGDGSSLRQYRPGPVGLLGGAPEVRDQGCLAGCQGHRRLRASSDRGDGDSRGRPTGIPRRRDSCGLSTPPLFANAPSGR